MPATTPAPSTTMPMRAPALLLPALTVAAALTAASCAPADPSDDAGGSGPATISSDPSGAGGSGGSLGGVPDDGFLDVPGGRVAYRITGGGDGLPLLVIHGGPGSTSCTYPSTLGAIAEERPVVTWDQLGTGHSDRIADTTLLRLPRFVDEVRAVREQLGLERFHVMGHSWGGTVALEYLLETGGEGVASAVFVGPLFGTGRWIEDARALVSQLPPDVQAVIREAEAAGRFDTPEFEEANDVFMAEFGTRGERSASDLPECVASPGGNGEIYRHMWGPSEFLSTGSLRDYDRTDRLDEVAALGLPVLFVAGEYDEARPETMREYAADIPGSEVAIVPDAGHSVNLDGEEAFNRAVADFLARVEGG